MLSDGQKSISRNVASLTLFRCAFLGVFADGVGKYARLSKICLTYPTIMKLVAVIQYVKNIQQYMNHMTHPLGFADIIIFSLEISNFCYIKKYGISSSFNFFQVLKGCFNKLGCNFVDVSKIGYFRPS